MDQGKIIEQGPAKKILTQPENQRTKDFLSRVL
jgi:ABC-type polar amino acid transport system ATPase subunit